jgi:hypothetical protein
MDAPEDNRNAWKRSYYATEKAMKRLLLRTNRQTSM